MGRYAEVAKKAAVLTNKQLANEISSLSAMRDQDVSRLLKLKEDREQFIKLMEEVEKETDDTTKAAFLRKNIAQFAPVIIKTLKFFV